MPDNDFVYIYCYYYYLNTFLVGIRIEFRASTEILDLLFTVDSVNYTLYIILYSAIILRLYLYTYIVIVYVICIIIYVGMQYRYERDTIKRIITRRNNNSAAERLPCNILHMCVTHIILYVLYYYHIIYTKVDVIAY